MTTPDLTGRRFTRLTVLRREPNRSGHAYWLCACDCGNEAHADSAMLLDGRHRSCGCLKRERLIAQSTSHGAKPRSGGSPTYNSWMNMLRRCTNPNHPRYADWGGRGITVCERWQDFALFLADMGEKPSGTTLERMDNNGNYEPGNCTWATPAQQGRNTRGFKLTPPTVAEIRALAASGLTQTAIGSQLGLNRHTVAKALWTG
jgi:hypothetical protein